MLPCCVCVKYHILHKETYLTLMMSESYTNLSDVNLEVNLYYFHLGK